MVADWSWPVHRDPMTMRHKLKPSPAPNFFCCDRLDRLHLSPRRLALVLRRHGNGTRALPGESVCHPRHHGGEGFIETWMPATGGHDVHARRRRDSNHMMAMTFAQMAIIPTNRASE